MKPVRAHALYHADFEGLGAIKPWLASRSCQLGETRLHAGERLPEVETVDWLIVMGGPMSVHDEKDLPWLREEKRFIAACIDAGKVVLGFCLGAQLIAHVRGAEVTRNAYREIGWFPVQAVAGEGSPARWVPEILHTFHWHGETFALPPGAVHLASSQGCVNQAFMLGERVVGLQFHPEMRREDILALREHCADELQAAAGQRFVQTGDDLLGQSAYFEANRYFLEELLSSLHGRASQSSS